MIIVKPLITLDHGRAPVSSNNNHASAIPCPGCDLLLTPTAPLPGYSAHCPRCARQLHKWKVGSIEKTMALSLTGLLLYIPANFAPLLTFEILGIESRASLFKGTMSMFGQGQYGVGLMVTLCGFVFPFIVLALLFYVSSGLYFNRSFPWMPQALCLYHHLKEWAMSDVYLIGIFITIIKMRHMAAITSNVGFFCFIGVVLATIAAQASLNHQAFWSRLDPGTPVAPPQDRPGVATGREAGLCLCPTCEKVIPLGPDEGQHCPRCGQHIHLRGKESLSRTWALIITAMILTLPANLLPIMEVQYFGVPDQSTIMDGIIYFFEEGSYAIGAIILTASILVPLFKIVGMLLILLTIHFRKPERIRHKALMFRFISFIGRWSMLDIFVIALLCALVRFGFLSTITPAPATFYFTGVVLCTMFAAISFDPRLLWDTTEGLEEEKICTKKRAHETARD